MDPSAYPCKGTALPSCPSLGRLLPECGKPLFGSGVVPAVNIVRLNGRGQAFYLGSCSRRPGFLQAVDRKEAYGGRKDEDYRDDDQRLHESPSFLVFGKGCQSFPNLFHNAPRRLNTGMTNCDMTAIIIAPVTSMNTGSANAVMPARMFSFSAE